MTSGYLTKKRIIHNRNETDIHLLCKVMFSKMLLQLNHKVYMEKEIPGRKPDVIDDTTKGIYEFETNPKKDYIKEFEEWANGIGANAIMISLNKMPTLLRSSLEYDLQKLKEWLEDYII
jgi:hypothetical protein